MLKSLKLRKKKGKKKKEYSFYQASSPTYDYSLFKLKFYIVKFIHSSFLVQFWQLFKMQFLYSH